MKLFEYTSRQQAADWLSKKVAGELAEAIERDGKGSLAVAGGNTPELFYRTLNQADLDWEKITITNTDERRVDIDDARSNAGQVHQYLLQHNIPRSSFFALNEHAELTQVRETFNQHCVPLNVCVLGMGNDGHIASLFPGEQDLLNPECDEFIAYAEPPGDLEPRITLTARALLMAKYLHLLIYGKEKLSVLMAAQTAEDVIDMPVRVVLQQADERLLVHYAE